MAPKAKTAAAKPKAAATSSHGSYLDMAKAAILSLKERNGSSRQAIKKYIQANNNLGATTSAQFNNHLNKALASDAFERPKGPSGPVKLKKPAATAKPAEKKATKPAAAKKTTTTKAKKPAAKKATKAPATKKAAAKPTAKPKANAKAPRAKKPAAAPAVEAKPAVVLGKTKSGRVTKSKAPAAKKPAAKKAAPKKTPTKKAAAKTEKK